MNCLFSFIFLLHVPQCQFGFISEDMIADMMKPEFRNYVKDLTSSKYGIVTDAKPNSNGLPHVASFRKLNID